MVGGTNGGICHGLLNLIFIFHLVKLCFESGLRTKTIVIIGKLTTISTLYNEAGR